MHCRLIDGVPHDRHLHNHLPLALQTLRKARDLTQEDFSLVSSRTYISSLERGMKVPTLAKVDQLAAVLEVHPLTLLALSYMAPQHGATWESLVKQVAADLTRCGLRI